MTTDPAALRAQVRDSYETAEALDVHRRRVDSGLRIWESAVVEQYFPPTGRVLTVGCGAGRETFALEQRGLEQRGYDAQGVDISPALCHLFSPDELTALGREARFDDAIIRYTSDFGETWDNVLVGVYRTIRAANRGRASEEFRA